jgi:hypothetical protein
MRLREQVIGVLNLFRADPGALAPGDIRVGIEPAQGKLAERLGVDMNQAFSLLRDRARVSNRRQQPPAG